MVRLFATVYDARGALGIDDASQRYSHRERLPAGLLPSIYTRASQPSGDAGFFLGLPSLSTWNVDNSLGKFLDPWIMQQPGVWGSDAGGPIPEGRGYLDMVPANGAARVDAMLSKIAGKAGDTIIVGRSQLAALGKVLNQRIDAEALRTRAAVYRLWDWMASKTGGNSFYVAAALAALKWITGLFDPGAYGAGAKAHFMVADSMAAILDTWGRSIANQVPYPWHAFEVLPVNVPALAAALAASTADGDSATAKEIGDAVAGVIADTAVTDAAIRRLDLVFWTLDYNARRFLGEKPAAALPGMKLARGLPQAPRYAAQAWWSMFLATMNQPGVERVWRAMHGGTWGAFNLASDEQVMAVAAPVAAVYGVPLRSLAIEVWNRSPGWAGEVLQLDNQGFIPPGDYGPGSGGNSTTPTNATQVQWGQLAANAIMIADAMKKGEPIPPPGELPKLWELRARSMTSPPGGGPVPEAPTSAPKGGGSGPLVIVALLAAAAFALKPKL